MECLPTAQISGAARHTWCAGHQLGRGHASHSATDGTYRPPGGLATRRPLPENKLDTRPPDWYGRGRDSPMFWYSQALTRPARRVVRSPQAMGVTCYVIISETEHD